MSRAEFALLRGRLWAPSLPGATALAASGGRIVAVGSDAHIRDMVGPETRVFDAGGRRVLPGLTDAHLHFVPGGLRMGQIDLAGVPDRETFLSKLSEYVRHNSTPSWVLGGGWSNDAWPDRTTPHRDWIDGITGDRPCWLLRMDCHAGLANSAALAAAGIDDAGPASPAGGAIDRDPATGRPTGILRDTAMPLVQAVIPPPTESQRDAALRDAQQHAHRLGLTMVHNMLDMPDWPAVRRARDSGELTIRMFNIVHQRPDSAGREHWCALQPGDDRVWCGACKNYMDGSLGSRTAWMLQPYLDGAPPDAPCGLRVNGREGDDALLAEFLAADAAGIQLCTHAIGDAANRRLLDLYEQVARRAGRFRDAGGPRGEQSDSDGNSPTRVSASRVGTGRRVFRPRVEHAQHLDAADVRRFARIGAVASMQPLHKFEDGAFAERVMGRDRAAGSYRFRDLIDAGAVLAFGSDWPIVSLNPFEGLHAAVTGATRGGARWLESQSVTVAEALTAYTRGAAHACNREHDLGQIRPGFCCDLTVLDSDPFATDLNGLRSIRSDATVVAGEVVWKGA